MNLVWSISSIYSYVSVGKQGNWSMDDLGNCEEVTGRKYNFAFLQSFLDYPKSFGLQNED